MREPLIFIICLSAISVRCSNTDDGFNLYKNYLRALPSDTLELDPESEDPVFFFYRTPIQLYPGLFSDSQDMKYRKRDWGIIKSRMLNKKLGSRALKKRTSKAALSLMLQSKNPDHTAEGHYCPYEELIFKTGSREN